MSGEESFFEEEEAGPACRVCGCTEMFACPGGCGWVREPAKRATERSAPICTTCEDDVLFARGRVRDAGPNGISWAALAGDVEARIEEGAKERAAKVVMELFVRGELEADLRAVKPKRSQRMPTRKKAA